MKIWYPNTYKCLKTLNNDFAVHSFCSISDKHIECDDETGKITLFDLDSIKVSVKTFKAHDHWISLLLLFFSK
jgi:hypothetical protein